jgi:hypothetical protein
MCSALVGAEPHELRQLELADVEETMISQDNPMCCEIREEYLPSIDPPSPISLPRCPVLIDEELVRRRSQKR